MRNGFFLAATLISVVVFAADDSQKKDGFDPEAYQRATEKLNAKPSTQPMTDIEKLMAENASLRQRVAELEAMLGLKKADPLRQVKTFTTLGDIANSIKPPADPRKPWTTLQQQKAQRDIESAVIGCRMEATGNLFQADGGGDGFNCLFSKPAIKGKKQGVSAHFDARYSDLITSWKVGQSISFVGTISSVSIYQDDRSPGGLAVSVQLKNCIPK